MTYDDLHDLAGRLDRRLTAALEWINEEAPTVGAVLVIAVLLWIGASIRWL